MLKPIFENLALNSDKFEHYFPLYEQWFGRFVGKSPRILEIGVQHGGDAEMWFKYFGKGTTIWGVDIAPQCRETEYLKLFVGDQGSPAFWNAFLAEIDDKFDIVIDDGSHENSHQIMTLAKVYGVLKGGGVYWCEDTHTSYYNGVRVRGGGYENKNSFVEYAKRLVDVIHSHHTHFAIGVGPTPNGPHVDTTLLALYDEIQGIHFYDSVVVIEKGPRLRFERVIHTGSGRPHP